MALERMFLDWQRPILPQAAEYLLQRYAGPHLIDARRAIVVLPGNEAGRRFQQILLEQAEQTGKVFLPPQVHTESQLPEKLYDPKRPAASDFTQLFVWAEVLRQAKPEELTPLVPNLPRPEAIARWLDLARLLKNQHETLAREGLGFEHVAQCAAVRELPEEERRWQAMLQLQLRYLARIDALGYWDRQTARRKAIEFNECRTENHIVLIGTVDLMRVLRDMLDQVAHRPEGNVMALIHAPAELAARFDRHGCVNTETWLQAELPFEEEQIIRTDGANEQAAAIASELARLGTKWRADQITIGLPDETLAPTIDRKLRQHQLKTRFIGSRTLGKSGPVQLLAAVAAYLQQRDYPSFAALVRHPDIFAYLEGIIAQQPPAATTPTSPPRREKGGGLLAELDRYYNQRLPSDFDLSKVKVYGNKPVESLANLVKKLLEPLMGPARPLAQWLPSLRELLTSAYAHAEFSRDDPTDRPSRDAFSSLATAMEQLESVPVELAPPLSAAETIALALEKLKGKNVPPPRDPAAIEMLGWLELPQDDAPVLLVTSFNEGRVPSYVDADLFLPEPIRRELGVDDNDRRYARDCYATSVLLHARQEVKFIVARRNVAGDPLTPSRLLFATNRETLASRAVRIFSEENAPLPPSTPPVPLPEVSLLPVPPTEAQSEVRERFSVSSFKAYLECPYRYYLRHVLRLEELSDKAQELEANTFGELLHKVLDSFGRDPSIRSADDPKEISDYLEASLKKAAKTQFHSIKRGAIAVQLEQLRTRLAGFANWQAEQVQQGWEIWHVEESLKALWEVDGVPVTLHGRVDRIDLHRTTGQARVFDYKSGDSANTPERAHRKKEDWVDLQLPLYRHLARAAGIEGNVELGYIALPKDTRNIGHLLAPWGPADLAAADEVARTVIRSVRANRFQPMSLDIKPQFDSFAAICQSRTLGQRPAADSEEEDSL